MNKIDYFKTEDWASIALGSILLIFAIFFKSIEKIQLWNFNHIDALLQYNYLQLSYIVLMLGSLFFLTHQILEKKKSKFIFPFLFLSCLTYLAVLLSRYEWSQIYGFGYAFWALMIGLIISNIFRTPTFLIPVLKAELYVKTGLVLLGAEIIFSKMTHLGLPALSVAWIVTPIVIIFMYYFGTKILKMNKQLSIVIATATSVCGVSAAIACAAACRAKKEELTLAVSMTLIFTVIMMITLPVIVDFFDIDPLVGGAWIGGTIDSTGAVVAAGAVLGQEAMNVAAIVKMIQNIMVGVVAFIVAIIWSIDDNTNQKVSYFEIWHRFPKFILGFIGSSIIFSFILQPLFGTSFIEDITHTSMTYRSWLFTMAFLVIGMESNFTVFAKYIQNGKPIWLYIVGQGFNLILTLIVAIIAFGGTVFALT